MSISRDHVESVLRGADDLLERVPPVRSARRIAAGALALSATAFLARRRRRR